MNLGNYTALVIPSILVVAGWIITHQLSARRDLANRRREQRVKYLIESFRVFAKAMNRLDRLTEIADDLEMALADIQFLGNEQQIHAAYAVAGALSNPSGHVEFAALLFALRSELRKEMGRPELGHPMTFPIVRNH